MQRPSTTTQYLMASISKLAINKKRSSRKLWPGASARARGAAEEQHKEEGEEREQEQEGAGRRSTDEEDIYSKNVYIIMYKRVRNCKDTIPFTFITLDGAVAYLRDTPRSVSNNFITRATGSSLPSQPRLYDE